MISKKIKKHTIVELKIRPIIMEYIVMSEIEFYIERLKRYNYNIIDTDLERLGFNPTTGEVMYNCKIYYELKL